LRILLKLLFLPTSSNVADGLQAVCTCCEVRETAVSVLAFPSLTPLLRQMVIFSAMFIWALCAQNHIERSDLTVLGSPNEGYYGQAW
jgi:hypothetical protein